MWATRRPTCWRCWTSVAEAQGELRAAPAYDVLTTHPYGDTTLVMPILGKDREDVTRKTLLALGSSCDVPERAVARMLDTMLRRFGAVVDDVEALPFDPRTVHRLRRLMRDRATKLAA